MHLDLDVHDPKKLQANRYAHSGGPRPAQLRQAVCGMAGLLPIVGITVSAYDPAFDAQGRCSAAGRPIAERSARHDGGKLMLKARVIPCLDVKDGRVVKGVNFVDLIDAGDPVEAAMAYDAAGADELCFLDITASSDNRETIFDVVARTAEQCFMPLTVGGGVRQVADIRKLLLAGADKVSINTAAVKNPDFVAEAADKFGNQCIVVAIDAKKVSAPARPTAGKSSPMAAASRPASTRSSSRGRWSSAAPARSC